MTERTVRNWLELREGWRIIEAVTLHPGPHRLITGETVQLQQGVTAAGILAGSPVFQTPGEAKRWARDNRITLTEAPE
jgi:hypothetical protein